MNRAAFLRRLVATSAGLLIAPDALELLVEPRRKLWAGARFSPVPTLSDIDRLLREEFIRSAITDTVSRQTYLLAALRRSGKSQMALGQARHFVFPVSLT